MEKIVIANPVRTAIGNFGGALRTLPAYDLAALVLSEATGRSNLKSDALDMVIMGQNYQSGEYVNIARMALLKAGVAVEIPALTLDRRCPSGLDAICLAAMSIQSQNAEVVLAGGVESMSTAEFYLPGEMRWSVGGSGDMPRGHGSLASWSLPLYDRILRATTGKIRPAPHHDDLGGERRQGTLAYPRRGRPLGPGQQPKSLRGDYFGQVQG
jgi:acetyl-CoA C-acetyltransferase